MNRPLIATLLVAASAAAATGCGSGTNYTGASTANASTSVPGGGAIGTSSSAGLGTVLVDGQGRTLYMFERDTRNHSNCSGACTAGWPFATPAKAGKGVKAADLKTFKRSDGTRQISFDGHPLYRFSGDNAKGDAHGEGLSEFGGRWYAVRPDGTAVMAAPAAGAGSGYGAY